MWAANRVNSDALQFLLENGADVALKNKEGKRAFDYAEESAGLKKTDAYNNLREKTVNAFKNTPKDVTEALLTLIRTADADEAAWFIREGAGVNAVDEEGLTPLMLAAMHNSNPDVLRLLIESGADVNAVSKAWNRQGWTPLFFAVYLNKNPDILRVLIENEANVAIKDNSGQRAFDYANRHNVFESRDVYAFLRGKTIEAIKDATEILLTIAKDASVDEVTQLIREGANVNAIGYWGMTPLMWAAQANSNPDVVQILIENGADVNAAVKDGHRRGWTPLTGAAENNSNLDVLRLLLKNGANVDAVGGTGWAPLLWAAHNRSSNAELFRILLEYGADVNAVSDSGSTPLLAVARNEYSSPEVLRLLLENGADVNVKDITGTGVLDYAERNPVLKGTDAYNLLREKTLSK